MRERTRTWWLPPRRAGEQLASRQVSFLELFYDLAYVVIIAELSHAFAAHPSWPALGRFAFLFTVVWWAWLNGTLYHDLHGNNDVRTRVFTFLQMFSVVGMAAFAHDALGSTSVGFALAYAAFQILLTYLWWRTGIYDPDHHPLSGPYALAFLAAALLFIASVFVAAPLRFWLWGLALLLSLLMPLVVMSLGRRDPAVRSQVDIITSVRPSLVERFGLFTIIVLGEVIVAVVAGLAGQHEFLGSLAWRAASGILLAVAIWWLYFDWVSHRAPRAEMWSVSLWLYLHLPLAMAITALGAMVAAQVANAPGELPALVSWVLVGALGLAVVCIALLTRTLQPKQSDH